MFLAAKFVWRTAMGTLAAPIITDHTIQELSPSLFAFAYRAVRQREEAEDLVQDTWISALRTVPSFEGRSTLRTWLVSILRRRIADRFRKVRRVEPLEEERIATGAGAAEDRLDAFEAAGIAAQEFDRDEASESLGVTRGHLRVLLHRGRAKLEASLRAKGIDAAR
jgi:DNA-directed RNA polymerase specialized sigma24 family protein